MKYKLTLVMLAILSLAGCTQGSTPDSTRQNQPHVSGGHADHPAMIDQMNAQNELSQDYDFHVISEKPARAGRPATLLISVKDKNGQPVGDLGVSHEKLMHLFIISSDMTEFQHVHPRVIQPGLLRVDANFAKNLPHVVFAQFVRTDGREATVRQNIDVGGISKPAQPYLIPDDSVSKTKGGFTFTLKEFPKAPNQLTDIIIAIDDHGAPVTGIESYLGAAGHIVIIGEDTQSFLHVHPLDQANTNGKYSSPVRFQTLIPRRGLYRMFAEFKINGRVRKTDFTFEVR